MKLYFDFIPSRINSLLYVISVTAFLIPHFSHAQLVNVSSNYIEVVGDTNEDYATDDGSGHFSLGTSSTYSLPLATISYNFPDEGWSSFVTAWVNGILYDCEGGAVVSPMTTTGTGLGAYVEETFTVVTGLQMKQHFEIVNNPQTGLLPDTVMFEFVYTNVGATSFTFGSRLEFDTDINTVDGANLSVNNGASTIPANTIYRINDGDMKPQWWGYDIPPPGVANLVATGSVYNNSYDLPATEPDALEVALWPDVEGPAVWAPGTLGDFITDSSVVYWWTGGGNETVGTYVLNPGQSKTFITYVGLNQIALLTTNTPTPVSTPTNTATNTATCTPTNTATITISPTYTNTATVTPTFTPSNTCTVTPTFSPTPTFTPTCVTYVWPDPYNPKTAVGNTLRVSCMNAQTTVNIYTISGELVQTLDSSTACQVPDMWGMVYCWNGRNKKGYPVAAGIYIYVVEQNNQAIQRGKFLMLNGS